MKRKKQKGYYIALKKSNNDIIVCTSKTAIAQFLNVHYTTIYRHLLSSLLYEDSECIIWCNIPIQKIRTRVDNLPQHNNEY
jgi:hypothetical protein